jgi:carbonic anhydrase
MKTSQNHLTSRLLMNRFTRVRGLMKISGFDQITGWIAGIAISGALFSGFWYMAKNIAEKSQALDAARLSETEKHLLSIAASHALKETSSESSHGDEQQSTNSLNPGEATETFEAWGYAGNLAPWYWSTLNEKWAECGQKAGQSPIDISGSKTDESLKALKFYYRHGITHLILHHETIQGDVDPGSYLDWDGERFDLKRVFFRTPSEHRVNGLPWEMEVQLEHIASTGKILMLSVMITTGKATDFLARFSERLPRFKDDIKDIERLNWSDLIPAKRTYWTYTGSQTMPPCTPDTKWVIMTDTVSTSKKLIDQIVLLQKSNVRPVFQLGKRELLRSNR